MSLPEPYYTDEFCTIYHGDSRELLPLLDADVMVTDPPYGIQHTGGGFNGARVGVSIVNDHDTNARDNVLESWGVRAALVFGSPLVRMPDGTKQVLVWQKDSGAGVFGAINGWRRDWEPVYVLGLWPSIPACGSSIFRHDGNRADAKTTGHPHAKPQNLMRELIGKCPPGTIIDPFMGSGSTLRAAKDLGRKCIGIEIDAKWCDVAVRRLAQDNLFTDGAA